MINDINDEEAWSHYSDTFKDAYGTRPRGAKSWFLSLSAEERDQVFRSLSEEIERAMFEEENQQRLNIAKLETRIQETRQMSPGSSRRDAIRWIVDAELGYDTDYYGPRDYEFVDYVLDLPYGHISKLVLEAEND